MLFATLGQGWIFLLMIHLGFCVAVVDEIFRILPAIFKQIKLKKDAKKLTKNTQENTQKISFSSQQKSSKNNKKLLCGSVFSNINICLRVIFAGAIFYLGVLFFNYGAVRFYLILAFFVGFWLERNFIAKTVLYLFQKVYNLTQKEH